MEKKSQKSSHRKEKFKLLKQMIEIQEKYKTNRVDEIMNKKDKAEDNKDNSKDNNKDNQIKEQTEILSFRKAGEADRISKTDGFELSKKVSNTLLQRKVNDVKKFDIKKNNESKEALKKLFMKKNEKELEIFDSERLNNHFEDNFIDNAKLDKGLSGDRNKSNHFKALSQVNKNNNSNFENAFSDNNFNISTGQKVKFLNQVICTLSKIENGFATFVSSNDLIFVIPSLFIPKNLNIGNTYVFKLGEVEQAEDKLERVNNIHNFYANEQND